MKIGIITPAPPGSTYGNRVTALRWAGILKRLGHEVIIEQEYRNAAYHLLIALHARRSYRSIKRFHSEHPQAPIVVALTGTDLYRDLRKSHAARDSLALANCIVVLQPKALEELAPDLRRKAAVIYQSAERASLDDGKRAASTRGPISYRQSGRHSLDVCVIGHLRPVKDPFRAALAARLLPASSRIRILQVGEAMTMAMATRAGTEMKRNSRYRWLTEQPQSRVRRLLSRCWVCVLSSRIEGGANVLSEAIVAGVPVLASRIPGSVGILQDDYPGYFTVGDTDGLATLLRRAETNPRFLDELKRSCQKLTRLFEPQREERAWVKLLRTLVEMNSGR